ncbi:hypothetical protein Pyn_21127 [Prunus yedoensis var. nudiflora]|uniref:Uncharacterized protein n=1 Tax=Prunus yedoensis var. nudiflora TaxID=2094558 RepID=A0A314XNZ7_PRUYE|nr:hypothetical protein Pyn_21127 [Prunus yedoensis var. nudiflora]
MLKTLCCDIPKAVERFNQVGEKFNSELPEMFDKFNRVVQFMEKKTTIVSVWEGSTVTFLSFVVTTSSCYSMARAMNAREKRAAAAAVTVEEAERVASAARRASQATPVAPGLLGLHGAGTAATAAEAARATKGAAATEGQVTP